MNRPISKKNTQVKSRATKKNAVNEPTSAARHAVAEQLPTTEQPEIPAVIVPHPVETDAEDPSAVMRPSVQETLMKPTYIGLPFIE